MSEAEPLLPDDKFTPWAEREALRCLRRLQLPYYHIDDVVQHGRLQLSKKYAKAPGKLPTEFHQRNYVREIMRNKCLALCGKKRVGGYKSFGRKLISHLRDMPQSYSDAIIHRFFSHLPEIRAYLEDGKANRRPNGAFSRKLAAALVGDQFTAPAKDSKKTPKNVGKRTLTNIQGIADQLGMDPEEVLWICQDFENIWARRAAPFKSTKSLQFIGDVPEVPAAETAGEPDDGLITAGKILLGAFRSGAEPRA